MLLAEILGRMDATPTTDYIATRIHTMSKEEVLEAIKLVRSLPGGRKAINLTAKTLTPKERKAMHGFSDFFISCLDLLNSTLETIAQVVYYLP